MATGVEGTEAITHITVSSGGKYLSICERNIAGKKGLFSVYEILSASHIVTLPDNYEQRSSFASREFVCSAFSLRKEEILVTLSGEPDW